MPPSPKSAKNRESDVISTPEGDNEFAPDQPLKPAEDIALEDLETPPGSAPDSYKRDHS
jgi:hypothetical protein